MFTRRTSGKHKIIDQSNFYILDLKEKSSFLIVCTTDANQPQCLGTSAASGDATFLGAAIVVSQTKVQDHLCKEEESLRPSMQASTEGPPTAEDNTGTRLPLLKNSIYRCRIQVARAVTHHTIRKSTNTRSIRQYCSHSVPQAPRPAIADK
jgi:hypothetical protein